MKRIISTIMTLSALALLLASCGKEPMSGKGKARAIKLTVSGVAETKASVITTDNISSFKISGYVTKNWRKDVIGQSPEQPAGLYVDPVGGSLNGIEVKKDTDWRIVGNEDYGAPAFSWINGVEMKFFAYAPSSMKGTLGVYKSDTSIDAAYPFTYAAKAPTAVTDPIASGDCDDLIFAYASNTATYGDNPGDADYGTLKSGSSDMIDLKFYHALAQIRFCVDPAEFTDMKLISAKLLGPKSTTAGSTGYVGIASNGSCTFTGPSTFSTWTLGTNRYAYSQTFNGTSGLSFASGAPTGWTSSTYGTSPDIKTIYTCAGDVILVIPQTLTDCGVEVKIQVGTDEPVLLQGKLPATTSSSTNVSWAAGYYYTYKIGTTGTQEDLGLSMTLVDWAERENYIPIN